MRNIRLTIEYDGTAYCGWQIQPNGPTVQAIVQAAISKMVRHPVKLIGASRTDAGVHALSQVANFKTGSRIPCEGFLRGLNSLLPADIVIKSVEDVPLTFHAKKDAKKKYYRYLIATGKTRPALMRNRMWHIGACSGRACSADIQQSKLCNYNAIAQSLIGTHDFSAFCGAGDCNKSKVRQVYKIKVSARDDIITIDIVGSGFLKYMVRNIVGTLIGLSDMKKILASRDRKKAGRTAPACGLYLVKVEY